MEELRGGRPPVELVGRPESSCFTNCLRTVGELFGAVAPRCGWRLATISIVAVGTIRIALDGGNLVGDAADRHGTETGFEEITVMSPEPTSGPEQFPVYSCQKSTTSVERARRAGAE